MSDASIRKLSASRKREKAREMLKTPIYKFDFTGQFKGRFKNVDVAIQDLGVEPTPALRLRIWRASSVNNKSIKAVYGFFWARKKEIPDKCFEKDSFILKKRQGKMRKKGVDPEKKMKEHWRL